ncbi:glypican-5-like isoform X2 [Watersipora subatra]|uniref:glypican-5-like isoform X2 n=1 Tax=Watersipora subatra TaxID=2589382 RepID=UPI00355C9A4C
MTTYEKCCSLLLLLSAVAILTEGRKIVPPPACEAVKESFQVDKPKVAATITSAPEYDGSLELCRFTNHSASQRQSCCTHDTENELLLLAQEEYTKILTDQTSPVITQMEPGRYLAHHFERMIGISKRMTEYELGNAYNLHHESGKGHIADFYGVLERILISYDRETSIFTAMDTLVDNIFVYVLREAIEPGSSQEPDLEYAACVKDNIRAIRPSPFPSSLKNQATSLHYSAVASSYLSEAMKVTFQALYYTRDFEVSDHCLRDLVKLNHCQKCYGYTQLKPCQLFCEDVFLVCLDRLVKLGNNWEYHRKVVKILAEYILSRVELQTLLNSFHTELKSNLDEAIVSYPVYKKQLQAVCGTPKMSPTNNRIKIWEKPETTSYEGDFTGDLRKLVVNLELKTQGFFTTLHSSICADELATSSDCWEGLTERVNKKKQYLEFIDEFAPYPEKNQEVSELILQIKKIRTEVLKIFLKEQPQDTNDFEGSGSGDMADDEPEDDEQGDVGDSVPTRRPYNLENEYHQNSVTSRLSTIYQNGNPDSSIEIVEKEQTTLKRLARTSRAPPVDDTPVKGKNVAASSAQPLTFSTLLILTNSFLVLFIFKH